MDKKTSEIDTDFPDYIKIYSDLIIMKYPEKVEECQYYLSKKKLSTLEVIKLNEIIFGKVYTNQKYRSYDHSTIIAILDYQKTNRMNDSELANHYSLSRNTVKKWKEKFSKK
ncbi:MULTISPECIES: helix-turn-helix domain-containing protein [unclassified Chryseobacterium]|uniref:helix-turn-helix domain-containing protein n=1 Tax=unclassified Chryseobacterium TaxID=2593645 RepID=UPI003010294E